MSVLHTRVRRTLGAQKGRYAGIVVLVLLGSFYVTAATGVAGSLERMVLGFADQYRQEDLTFTTDEPLADVTSWETESGAAIEEQQRYDVTVPDGELRLLVPGSQVNRAAVTAGRGLQDPGEILVDPRFLQYSGTEIGGRITLDGSAFTVVGTVAVPHYVYILKNYYDVLPTTGFGIGIVSEADMQGFPDTTAGGVTYSVRFTDREDLDSQIGRLREQLVANGHTLSEWMRAEDNPRITMPWGNIASMQSMSLPVSIAFFLLGCVIVGVLVMRAVRADSAVIGTLSALGYRRRELTWHYLSVPVLVAIAGGVAGTVLAVPAVGPVVGSMLMSYNVPSTGVSFSVPDLAFAVLAPVVLIGAASLLVIRRILGSRPADLMRGDDRAAKVNAVERVLRLDRFRFATTFRIREQVRSIPRLLFLLLGVAAASTTMLFGLGFDSSMSTLTEQGAVTRYAYPLEYNFTQVQNLRQHPLPDGAEPYHTLRVHPEGRESVELYLTGLEPGSVGMRLQDAEGEQLPRDQVNITSPLADRLGLAAGDMIRLVDQLDGATYELRIDGIVHAYGEQFVTMPLDDLNRMTGHPSGSYRTVLADHELDVHDSALAGVLDTRDPEAFDDVSAPTALIVASVTALAVVVATVILFLVTSLIVEESRSTVSLLGVLGYRRREVAGLVLGGTTPVVVVGALLGVPLMLGFGKVLYGLVADTVNLVIPVILTPLHVVIGLAVIVVVHRATTWLSGRRLARIPMSEALKAGSE